MAIKLYEEFKKMLLSEVSIKDYEELYRRFDPYYYQVDDQREYTNGQRLRHQIDQIYQQLSDEDKLLAAKIFKKRMSNSKDTSEHQRAIDNWDIERDGIKDFSGTSYRK